MWVRAVWLEKNREEEGVNPKCWIVDNCERWPPVVDASKLMRRMADPESSWRTFPLVKRKLTSEDREECESYDLTTTAEASENEMGPRPQRLKTKRMLEDYVQDSEDTASDQDHDPSPPPVPPKRSNTSSAKKHHYSMGDEGGYSPPIPIITLPDRDPKTHRSRSHRSRSHSSHSHYSHSHYSRSPCSHSHTSHSRPCEERHSRPRSRSSPWGDSRSRSNRSYSRTRSQEHSRRQRDVFPMEDKNIRAKLSEVGHHTEPSDSQFHLEVVNSREELEDLNKKLEQAEKRALMMAQMRKIGGESLREIVNNIMKRVLTNKVMSLLNMDGTGGKGAFKKTRLFQVMMGAIQQSQPQATEAAIAAQMAKYLRSAPDRKGGLSRSKATNREARSPSASSSQI